MHASAETSEAEAARRDGTLGLLANLTRRYPRRAATVTGLAVLTGIAEFAGVFSLLPLLAVVTENESEQSGIGAAVERALGWIGLEPTLGTLLAVIVVGIVVKSVLMIAALTVAGSAGAEVAADLRRDLIRSLLSARWQFFTTRPIGGLTNSVSSEAARASAMFAMGCTMVSQAVQVLVYLIVAFLVSWYVTIASIAFAGLLAILLRSLVRATRRAGDRQTDSMRDLISKMNDALSGLKPLRAMAREQALQPSLESDITLLSEAEKRLNWTSVAVSSLQEPLAVVFLSVGIYVATTYSSISFESMLFMAFLFYRTVGRIGSVQVAYQKLVGTESAFRSIRSATVDALAQSERWEPGAHATLARGIRFDSVSFTYGTEAVLRDLSLVIPARQMTALVGPSGVGKTTLIDLIVGLTDPTAGCIYIDDQPLPTLDLRGWRAQIGYVPQETFLLHDTIFANVVLGDGDSTTADVERALDEAGALDFVREMPDGVHTLAGERGARLSGGQRQRIAIARALIRHPALLILDEATTALDPVSEQLICDTVLRLRGSTTVLAISHQPALVDAADVVVRLERERAPEVMTRQAN